MTHCKRTWKWIPHLQNNILTSASVWNYHYLLRNNPEWCSFQLFHNYETNSYRKGISWRRFARVGLRTECKIGKGSWQFSKRLLKHTVLYRATQKIHAVQTTTIQWCHSKSTQYQFPAAVLLSHRQFCTATPHVH